MENASKALIMAAEILLGVMIVSVAVYFFRNTASFSESNYKKIDDAQIAQFNEQFLKYSGRKTVRIGGADRQVPIVSTIHDIASLANFARKNNEQKGVEGEAGISDTSAYVQIDVIGIDNHFEQKEYDELIEIVKNNSIRDDVDITDPNNTGTTKYYTCENNAIRINQNTGLVNYMRFRELHAVEYVLLHELEDQ